MKRPIVLVAFCLMAGPVAAPVQARAERPGTGRPGEEGSGPVRPPEEGANGSLPAAPPTGGEPAVGAPPDEQERRGHGRPKGLDVQITTGGRFTSSSFAAVELAYIEVGGGKTGTPGVCFTIRGGREKGAKTYGEMCSYGDLAPSGRKALHETFYWFKEADAWVQGRTYALQFKRVKAYEYAGPTGVEKTETFDNTPRCEKKDPAVDVPTSRRWEAVGALGTSAYLVRGGTERTPTLKGYWTGSQCVAVEPDNDGWIELKGSSAAAKAGAVGTAH